MRATMKTQANSSLYNLNSNYSRLAKLQQQLGTGSRLTRMADDPLAANISIQMDTLIARTTQYNRSIQTGLSFLGLSDTALGSVKTSIDRARYLTVQGATDTTTNTERQTIAVEMQSILQQIVSSANTYDGTRYIFGGSNTLDAPYEIIADRYVRYTGNDQNINIQVDPNNYAAINVTGSDAFGRLEGIVESRDFNPALNIAVGTSTPLADLNLGEGVPTGNIKVYYGAFQQQGIELNLSGCSTLEDIKDYIERETLRQSQLLRPGDAGYDPDLADRYLEVTLNAAGNGLLIRETDRGDKYNGVNGEYSASGHTGGDIRVENVGLNQVATALGIQGASQGGRIEGKDLNPRLSRNTLLTDLEGYDDTIYTITNGALPGAVSILEHTTDTNAVFHNWNLNGLTKGVNTGPDGELYAKVTVQSGSSVRAQHLDSQLVPSGAVLNGFVTGRPEAERGEPLYLYAERLAAGDFYSGGKLGAAELAKVNGTVYLEAKRTGENGPVTVTLYSDSEGKNILGQTTVPDTESGLHTVTLGSTTLDIDLDRINGAAGTTQMVQLDLVDADTGELAANPGDVRLTLYADAARTTPLASSTVPDGATEVFFDDGVNSARIDVDLAAIGAESGGNTTVRLDVTSTSTGAVAARETIRDLELFGLSAENTTNGQFWINAERQANGEVLVRIYSDETQRDLVAQGYMGNDGTVDIYEVNKSGLNGSLLLDATTLAKPGDTLNAVYNAGLEGEDEILLEIYRVPVSKALGSDLIATATSPVNGTFTLQEANNSGVTGTVGINLQPASKLGTTAEIDLEARFDATFRATIHVPAFTEADGNQPGADTANIASGWQISGLEKAVVGYALADYAEYYAQHATTGPDGELDVAFRATFDEHGTQNGWEVLLTRPEFTYTISEGQPPRERSITVAAETVATGNLVFAPAGVDADGKPVYNAVNQGRVELSGTPGHEIITGSVHLEMPAGVPDEELATPLKSPVATTRDIALDSDYTVEDGTTLTVPRGTTLFTGATIAKNSILPAGTTIPAGTVLPAGLVLPDGTALPADVTLKQDMVLSKDMTLTVDLEVGPDLTVAETAKLAAGSTIKATKEVGILGETLAAGTVLPAGTTLAAGSVLAAGTVINGNDAGFNTLPAGTVLASLNTLPAGTVIPAGSTFTKYSSVPPDGHLALTDEVLAADLTLAEPFTLAGPLVVGGGGLTIPAGRSMTLANDTALGADVTLAADQQFNAKLTAAQGSTLSAVLPAGTVFGSGSNPPAEALDGAIDGGAAMRMSLTATFATVEDLLNAVNASSTYVTARIDDNLRSLEFVSQLAGAHLVVSEGQEAVQQMGDNHEQLSHLNLAGVVRGENTDPEGNLHTEVVFYPEDVTIHHSGGEREHIEAGYYVRVYSDRNQTGIDYQNRDADTLVAVAFVPLENYQPGMTVNFEAKNNSNLSGSLQLNYVADDQSITLYPGGLRDAGSEHVTVSQMDIQGIYNGRNVDYDGQFHAKVSVANDGTTTLELYSDVGRTNLVATGVVGPGGYTELKEENGSRLSGSLVVDSALTAPTMPGSVNVESFVITTGGMRNTGHVREENVFATLNDVMDALHANDAEALHELLGQWTKDLNRLDAAWADVGSRTLQFEAYISQHEEQIIGYETIQANRIGTVYTDTIVEFQMAQNVYDASLKVAAQFMQMSLLDYL